MVSSNNMYLILEGWEKSKRTRGIRIEVGGDICMGVACPVGGGYRYQECLHNRIMKDEIASLRKKRVS